MEYKKKIIEIAQKNGDSKKLIDKKNTKAHKTEDF